MPVTAPKESEHCLPTMTEPWQAALEEGREPAVADY